MDVDTIRLSSDFAAVIEGAVKQCDVVVAVIGRGWLKAEGPDGRRRLDARTTSSGSSSRARSATTSS
jgi:hypothetical protein